MKILNASTMNLIPTSNIENILVPFMGTEKINWLLEKIKNSNAEIFYREGVAAIIPFQANDIQINEILDRHFSSLIGRQLLEWGCDPQENQAELQTNIEKISGFFGVEVHDYNYNLTHVNFDSPEFFNQSPHLLFLRPTEEFASFLISNESQFKIPNNYFEGSLAIETMRFPSNGYFLPAALNTKDRINHYLAKNKIYLHLIKNELKPFLIEKKYNFSSFTHDAFRSFFELQLNTSVLNFL